jgi:hypothetical protein
MVLWQSMSLAMQLLEMVAQDTSTLFSRGHVHSFNQAGQQLPFFLI